MTKITAIQTIRTRAAGRWVIVKVLTDQPGLHGIGSASDHFHAGTVIVAMEEIDIDETAARARLCGLKAGFGFPHNRSCP